MAQGPHLRSQFKRQTNIGLFFSTKAEEEAHAVEAESETPRHGRGRPKTIKADNDTTSRRSQSLEAQQPSENSLLAPQPRKRGRPRGSKNKPKQLAVMQARERRPGVSDTGDNAAKRCGRPPKGQSSSRVQPNEDLLEPEAPRNGRGRPRGSKSSSTPGRRGRPPKAQPDESDEGLQVPAQKRYHNEDECQYESESDTDYAPNLHKQQKKHAADKPPKRGKAQRDGPSREPQPIRANCIDYGTDESTWHTLRGMQAEPLTHHEPIGAPLLGLMVDGAKLAIKPFTARSNDCRRHIANTGLCVTTMDWTQGDYLAVGGTTGSPLGQIYTEREKRPGCVQIWHMDAQHCALKTALVHAFGRCLMLRWCPITGTQVVGLLAAVFGDGFLRVIAVPHTQGAAAIEWPRSLVEVRAPHGIFTSIDWIGIDHIVAGTSRGAVTVWPVIGSPHPVLNHRMHQGAVTMVHAHCVAPSTVGFTKISLSQIHIFSTGCDGRIDRVSLGMPLRQRHPLVRVPSGVRATAVFWPDSFVFVDADNNVRQFSGLLATGEPHSPHILHGVGSIHYIAASLFHPFIAVAMGDGQLVVLNMEAKKKRGAPVHRVVFELQQQEDGMVVCGEGGMRRPEQPLGKNLEFAVFPQMVGVQACAWSRDPDSAHWVAAATAGGLLRIDDVSPA
ncbi:hypothetical protein GGI25_001870 [Coemansia spiralis]|uniref:Uncharacterized protein n=2 Tax=Coemansia TaxID=4863 RepID=A0A9W8G9P1_9FUNG|nr:hypothetical protein BX070DRAFT_225409 [Coemansia spiralis]KAJ1993924.1 hypothetical protein EDC05_001835 [Coemansia umbellata]KAJ2622689.1 hypothetical protein GGI26_002958 [Coemansia sp. RSA 1358]KAJ2679098.1 hypothetical protein GGI25_001870 [Coemansia spiralis]